MLRSRSDMTIPEETVEVARKAFPKGNVYLTLRDELGPLYEDDEFADLFIRTGRPGYPPGLLAMVTVMQFAEGLTDRQAAEAVRSRLDWKYALGLEIGDSGFAHSVLAEFRKRLVAGGAEARLLNAMVVRLQEAGWLKGQRKQRTDSTRVLAAVRDLNRLEMVGETMRRALNDLAQLAPEWLLAQVTRDWFDLYGPRFDSYRLPSKKSAQKVLLQRIGADGVHVLRAIYAEEAPEWLWRVPSVQILRQVWVQQYYLQEDKLFVRSRQDQGLPPNKLLIESPYDLEARNRTKRDTNWTGYTVHLTETCEPDQPNFITHAATTPATTDDKEMVEPIHQALAAKGLLPEEHLLDGGYGNADDLVRSREQHEVELVTVVQPNPSWQAREAGAYDTSRFVIDWEAETVTCPDGKQSISWRRRQSRDGYDIVMANFSRHDCGPCPARERCVRGRSARRLTFRPRPQHEALLLARERQETAAYKQRYRARAGVEGTISQGVRTFDLRRTRYVGLAKTSFQHLATAAAMNITRLAAWLHKQPGRRKAKTRRSHFQQLALAA